MKPLLLALAACPLLALNAPALAQQTAAPDMAALVEVEDESRLVESLNLTVDDVEDMDIVDSTGEEIGEVEEVLMDGEGAIVALVADIGGFLDVGEKEVVLQLEEVAVQDDRLAVSLTREQLEALPEWDR